jgi:hypothetical protein
MTITTAGPLADYIRPAQTTPQEDLLPCERGRDACPDPRPIFSLEAFDLGRRVPGLIRRTVPTFGIFDPKKAEAACYFNPRFGTLAVEPEWHREPICQTRHRWRHWSFFAAIGVLIASVLVPLTVSILTGDWSAMVMLITAMIALPLFTWPSSLDAGLLMARYAGPIPAELRAHIRQLKHPLIVAPVIEWTKAPRPVQVFDPYLVEWCHGGQQGPHLHVEAWWDLSKEEIVLSEFITPGASLAELRNS